MERRKEVGRTGGWKVYICSHWRIIGWNYFPSLYFLGIPTAHEAQSASIRISTEVAGVWSLKATGSQAMPELLGSGSGRVMRLNKQPIDHRGVK